MYLVQEHSLIESIIIVLLKKNFDGVCTSLSCTSILANHVLESILKKIAFMLKTEKRGDAVIIIL